MSDKLKTPAEKSKSTRPEQERPWWFLAFIVLISASFGYLGGNLSILGDSSTVRIEQQRQVIDIEEQLIAQIAEEVGPSVVSIELEQRTGFGIQQSLGSGVIITEDGLIVTNKHVVEGASGITVVTAEGVEYEDVQLVDEDPFNDIAYLQIEEASGLKAAKIGNSTEVVVGQRVIAIGNALGEYPNTVTYGIISGLSRPVVAGGFSSGSSVESLENLFQTDAAINPGNSGGPLVSLDGEIIGINTAVAGNAENIGFSIPINDVKPGIDSVKENGELIRPYLGVRYVSLTSAIAERYDLDVQEGAYVLEDFEDAVLDGSPADSAGIEPGDVIVTIDGEKITRQRALSTIMAQQEVGKEVEIEIIRDGERQTIDVTLEAFED